MPYIGQEGRPLENELGGGGNVVDTLQATTTAGNTTTDIIETYGYHLYDVPNGAYSAKITADDNEFILGYTTKAAVVKFGATDVYGYTLIANGSLTAARNYYPPNASGVLALSVNGTYADVNGNIIIAGGGDTTTANNGLTETSDNIKLGGTLIENTTITNSGFYLETTGNLNYASSFRVYNTASNGIAASAIGSGTFGVGISADGGSTGVNASSTNGYGLVSASTNGVGARIVSGNFGSYALEVEKSNSTTAGTLPIVNLAATSTGTPANGFGGRVDINLESTSGDIRPSSQLISKWTDATDASRSSEFSITGVNNAVTQNLLVLTAAGLAIISQGAPEYADNAAAVTAGLVVGTIYRTGDFLKIVH